MRRSLIACSVAVLTLFGSGLQAFAYQPPYSAMGGFGVPYPLIPGMGSPRRMTPGVGINGPRLPQIPQIPRMPDEVVPQSPEMEPSMAMILEMLPPEARAVYLDSLQRIKELEAEKAAEPQASQQELQTTLGDYDPSAYHDPDVWELIKDDPLADMVPIPRIPYPQEPQLVKVASLNTPTSDISAPPSIFDVPLSDILKPPPGSSAAYVAIASSGGVSNPQPRNPFTYTGREDDGTGLMYYRGRYYDPELEVFISQDKLGNAQRYANGNPLKYTDPMGWEAGYSYGPKGEMIAPVNIPLDPRLLINPKANNACTIKCMQQQVFGLGGASAVVAGSGLPIIPVAGKTAGSIPGTSIASILGRQIPGRSPFPIPTPTIAGIRTTASIGGAIGRFVPGLGYIGLGVSAYQYQGCFDKCLDNALCGSK